MAKFAIARQLSGKRVITNMGEEIGKIVDIVIDEKSGKILSFLIEINSDSRIGRALQREKDLGIVPYDAVTAAGDVIIVDERSLGV